VNKVVASRHETNGFHLIEHGSDAPAQCRELPQRLLEDAREGEEAEGVSGRGGVEYDHRVFHGLDVPVWWGRRFQFSAPARRTRTIDYNKGALPPALAEGWMMRGRNATTDALHYLGKGHGLVYARNGKREILHHGPHHTVLIRCARE